MGAASSSLVQLTRYDKVAQIKFNRPEKLNVLDQALATELIGHLENVAGDKSVRAVVLSGEGRSFMAGADLSIFRDNPDAGPEMITRLIALFHRAMTLIHEMPKPVIAALNGPVAGGGFAVALACDLAIAADDATFLSAYTKLGTNPDGGTSWSLTHLVGPRKAMELILLNEPIDAETALSLGLVNRVVPAALLEEETLALAAKIAAGSAGATTSVKKLVHRAPYSSFAEALDHERDGFVAATKTADFKEGIAAFFERRPPRFLL